MIKFHSIALVVFELVDFGLVVVALVDFGLVVVALVVVALVVVALVDFGRDQPLFGKLLE